MVITLASMDCGDFGKRGVELYDYEKDPNETKNLANESAYVDVVKQLKELIKKLGDTVFAEKNWINLILVAKHFETCFSSIL